MENGKVSVVIPTYNRMNTLKDAIDSVFNQSYKNVEIIIVNDNGEAIEVPGLENSIFRRIFLQWLKLIPAP